MPTLTKLHTTKHGGLGWKRDEPLHIDIRDRMYQMEVPYEQLPPSVDLRSNCPPIYDQGQLGSCTANAIAGALEFDMMKQSEQAFTPSRLLIYLEERIKEGDPNQDNGAYIRDGIYCVAHQGVCPETEWPYDVNNYAEMPPQQVFTDALKFKALTYQKLRTYSLAQMKSCLASGNVFVFGFTVYASFESQIVANTGIVPMPVTGEQVLGGHAVCCVGYDDSKKWVICRNSWSDGWGDQGYFYMPYTYMMHAGLTSDLWTIRTVS